MFLRIETQAHGDVKDFFSRCDYFTTHGHGSLTEEAGDAVGFVPKKFFHVVKISLRTVMCYTLGHGSLTEQAGDAVGFVPVMNSSIRTPAVHPGSLTQSRVVRQEYPVSYPLTVAFKSMECSYVQSRKGSAVLSADLGL